MLTEADGNRSDFPIFRCHSLLN